MADSVEAKGSGSGRWAVRALFFLILAVVAAGAAALLLTRWVNTRIAIAHVPTVKVVVAAVDLPVGTSLSAESLKAIDWPQASRPESTQEDPAVLLGRVVGSRIFKNEPVLEQKLVSGRSGYGLAALLPTSARAVSVRVDDVVGVAGFIHPGDFVDVIVTMKPSESSGAQFMSKTILQNVRVLAVGKEIDPLGRLGDKTIPATVATLQVDTPQAEQLALAAAKGQLLLALRNGIDPDLVATRGVSPYGLLSYTEPAPPAAAPPPPAPPTRIVRIVRQAPAPPPAVVEAPPPPKERKVIEILRGDLFEQRDFDKDKEEKK